MGVLLRELSIRLIGVGLLSLVGLIAHAQQATIRGLVKDDFGNPLSGANVFIKGYSSGSPSDSTGRFSIRVPANQPITLNITFIGYDTLRQNFRLRPNQEVNRTFQMRFASRAIREFEVTDRETRQSTMVRIDPKSIDQLPTPNASIEKTLLFQGMGVSSNNELSSQYNVRGGNFDENLVYVNDVAIYRPFLVRSGQQEGLSFINPKLVSSVLFSSGGFEARYGDKMSSVLDVRYKEPRRRFGGSVEGSLLGGAVHIENASKNYRFTQIHGFRYRTNQYVLSGLDTDGDYQPAFTDYQTYLTYDVSDRFELGLLANYTRNEYRFVPETRETEFGNINEALRLTIFFDGQEINAYETMVGALTGTYTPSKKLRLKFITSAYRSLEEETYDVEGAYRLDELERDLGSDGFGEVAFSRGIGGFLNHARNFLDIFVSSAEHKGTYFGEGFTIDWGVKGQLEWIRDEFSEWQMIDSSGYSVPRAPNDQLELFEVIRTNNDIQSSRLTGYGQYARSFEWNDAEVSINIGGRFHYWDFNHQLVGGPRLSASYKPDWKRDIVFKAAWGYYHQPPFYREMRDLFGNINYDIKAQTSIHYVAGMDYTFQMWNRPFRFATEVYYKQLENLIPYEIDNVRLRYYAENNAYGYAAGIDFKINGEFVKGVESWASLSIMSTQENLRNDVFFRYFDANGEETFESNPYRPPVDTVQVNPGFIPRPTDQRVNFSLFFQDYLPGNPTVKMNLNLVFGSGLPFGPPSYDRFRDTLRIPPYRRVDIGLSKQLLRNKHDERKPLGQKRPFSYLQSAWISLEVFNLLQVNNTISYFWVRDITNRQYAVPNYLTSRQVNVRLIVDF